MSETRQQFYCMALFFLSALLIGQGYERFGYFLTGICAGYALRAMYHFHLIIKALERGEGYVLL